MSTALDRVHAWLQPRLGAPMVVGVQGPQGCGKSTLCAALVARLASEDGVRAVALSLDDFYLPDAALDHAHPDPRLRGRGNPGTHDVALLRSCLSRLGVESVAVPRYDKTAHGGRGDRAPEAVQVAPPVDVVLLEGWCVGFAPRGDPTDPVDVALGAYAFDAWCACLVVLHAPTAWVTAWRTEAETVLDAAGVAAFVARFLPSYEAYAPALWAREGPNVLHLTLARDRTVA